MLAISLLESWSDLFAVPIKGISQAVNVKTIISNELIDAYNLRLVFIFYLSVKRFGLVVSGT